MMKSDFNFNLGDAMGDFYPQYGKAYYTSNEPLQWEMETLPPRGARVLTVAGSGDQPLLYAANDATHVDTFDLTFNARVVMDFKTFAIKIMDIGEYIRAIGYMYDLEKVHVHSPKFSDAINNMPSDTKQAMREMLWHRPDTFCREIAYTLQTPKNAAEYERIRKSINGPFDFIWTDVTNLHKHLDTDYDIINMSNIFEHFVMHDRPISDIDRTLNNLWPRLRVGGHIICMEARTNVLQPLLAGRRNCAVTHPETPDPYWYASVIEKIR